MKRLNPGDRKLIQFPLPKDVKYPFTAQITLIHRKRCHSCNTIIDREKLITMIIRDKYTTPNIYLENSYCTLLCLLKGKINKLIEYIQNFLGI